MGKSPAQEMARKLAATKEKLAAERKKMKVKEDKGFGIKNAKGAKGAINVDRLRMAAARAGKSNDDIKLEEKKLKEAAEKRKLKKLGLTPDELLTGKKVAARMAKLKDDVDPKTVLCGFFKAGKCKQGKKCKFSHDMGLERAKKGKRDMYQARVLDTMDKWDHDKLALVVSQKDKARPNATKIVCKYFIEAIETKKYGWFWKCDNGDDCLYQHQLPTGFILKSELDAEEKVEDVDIGDRIELARSKLDRTKCTKVTPETFAAWKVKQKAKKLEEERIQIKAVLKEAKRGRGNGMTGRSLFTFKPSLFVDDEGAAENNEYETEATDDPTDETETKEWEAPPPLVVEADLFLEDADLPPSDDEAEAAAAGVAGLSVKAGEEKAAPAPAKVKVAPAAKEKAAPAKKLTKAEKAAAKLEKAAAKLAAAAAAEKSANAPDIAPMGPDECRCTGRFVCTNCR